MTTKKSINVYEITYYDRPRNLIIEVNVKSNSVIGAVQKLFEHNLNIEIIGVNLRYTNTHE